MKIRDRFKLWEARRREARMVVLCVDCGEAFNALWQSGICPHISVGAVVRVRLRDVDKVESVFYDGRELQPGVDYQERDARLVPVFSYRPPKVEIKFRPFPDSAYTFPEPPSFWRDSPHKFAGGLRLSMNQEPLCSLCGLVEARDIHPKKEAR